ncbi:MFS transporter [Microbulbifer marinus]|uniref:MFS transporter n=1 Tax=Microbulbifer marinus TaxID=658218 RepID=UPI000A89007C|nr:MFS transporter [Microbulbifer marinus]
MALALAAVWLLSLALLKKDLGKTKGKSRFRDVFSKSRAVNVPVAARLFLFASRDVWFVVALPVFLASQFGWDHWLVGGFLALWIIGYGIVQAAAPRITGMQSGGLPDGRSAFRWAIVLAVIPALIATALIGGIHPAASLLGGLLLFGIVFAVSSSLHSYLIVSYAREDGVSMDVGFYYMANALGRLLGTLLSGWVYQHAGLEACLWISSGFLLLTAAISVLLPKHRGAQTTLKENEKAWPPAAFGRGVGEPAARLTI